jgi:hypothetical protein
MRDNRPVVPAAKKKNRSRNARRSVCTPAATSHPFADLRKGTMTSFCSLRTIVVLLAAAGVLSQSTRAFAEERKHSSSGTAHFVSPTEFMGAGLATHLGQYTETGIVLFSPTEVPGILRIDAVATYTAANGDELRAIFVGQLDGLTGAITATVTYVSGTGRFVEAVGSATLLGQILGDGTISIAVDGTINY